MWTLAIAGIYVILALILFKNPNLFHKPSKLLKFPKKKILNIAHRGGCGEFPENTLEAFINSSYCDILELDVVVTKDNQVIISHDDFLFRLSGINEKISSFDYASLPKYNLKVPSHFLDSPFISSKPGKFALLEDLFIHLPNNYLCIDLKTPSHESVRIVTNLIEKYNRQDRTIVGSNNSKWNSEIGRKNPFCFKFMTMKKVILVYLAYLLGFISLMRIDEDAMCISMMTKNFRAMKKKEMGKIRAFIYGSVVDFFLVVAGPLNRYLNRRGVAVFYWVLNEEEEFDQVIKKGCNGIVTDYPRKLERYLKDKGLND